MSATAIESSRLVQGWPCVRIRVLTDPLGPTFREELAVDWHPGTSIQNLAPQTILARLARKSKCWAIVGGEKIPSELWDQEVPASAGWVTFMWSPEDPITLGIILVVAAVGTYMISKQLAPPKPPSPTYAFGPFQTQTATGLPIPVVFGRHMVPGLLIGRFVTVNDQGDSVLNMLIALSEGPIAGIGNLTSDQDGLTGTAIPTGIRINNVEASQIPGVEISWRLGANDQSVIPGFDDTTTGYVVGTVVNQNYPVTYRTNGQVDSLEVILTFAQGLYYQGKILHKKSVPITIKYQKLTALGGPINPNGWTVIDFKVTKKLTSPFSISKKLGPLDNGYYAIEVTRNWIDDDAAAAVGQSGHVSKFTLDTVNEVVFDDSVSYGGTAILAVKALATDSLNGGAPNVATLIDGMLVYVWTLGTVDNPTFALLYTNNPAWCVLAMLTNSRYGSGEVFTLADVDLQSFKDWADFCDELIDDSSGTSTNRKRFEFNGVFDTQEPIWDQVQKIAASARAVLIKTGRVVKVKIERAASPIQMFSAGNILYDSFRWTGPGVLDKPNFIEVQFLNAENDYAQDTATMHDPDITNLYRKQTTTMYGITHAYQAYRQAKFLLNLNQLIRRSIEFEAPIDSVAAEPGDVIVVQHDLPEWGLVGGRVIAATSNSVTLDRTVSLLGGSAPRISVRTNALGATWAASTFTWGSAFGTGRNWIGSTSETIQTRAITPPGSWAASTFTWASATATRWSTVAPNNVITVASAWNAGDVPSKGDLYIFDRNSSATPVGKQYRITEVSRTQDYRAKIRALEYNVGIYDDDPGVIDQKDGSDPFSTSAIPPDVTNLDAIEIVSVQTDGTAVSTIQVSWNKPNFSAPYICRVWIEASNIPYMNPTFALVGETTITGFTITTDSYEVGFSYKIAVTSRAIDGNEKDAEDVAFVTITPTGVASAPPDVTGFSGVQNDTEIALSWDPVLASDLRGYEIRYGSSWSSGTVIATDIIGTSHATTTWIPGTNTYWIKARNTTGAYSVNAASTDVLAVAIGLVAIDEEEAPDWNGTRVNYNLQSPYIISASSNSTWAASTFTWGSAQAMASIWQGVDATYETAPYIAGSWQSKGTDTWAAATYAWNSGTYGIYSLTVALDSVDFNTLSTWAGCNFAWNSDEASVSDWSGVTLGDAHVVDHHLKIALSADGSIYGAYQDYVHGDYVFKTLKVLLESSGASTQYRARVRSLRTVATT